MRFAVLVSLFALSAMASSAQTSNCAGSLPSGKSSKCDTGIALIVDSTSLPVTTVNTNEVVIRYVNRFHFGFGTQIQSTNIAAPTEPALLAPSVATFQTVTLPNPNTSGNNSTPLGVTTHNETLPVEGTSEPPPGDSSWCQKLTWPSSWTVDEDNTQINLCWKLQLTSVQTQAEAAESLRIAINKDITKAALEQRCYVEELRYFGSPLLSYSMATELWNFAKSNATAFNTSNNMSCRQSYEAWDLDKAATIDSALSAVQSYLAQLSLMPGYKKWIGDPQNAANNTALNTQITAISAEVESYGNIVGGQPPSAAVVAVQTQFQSTVDSNNFWRAVLASIAASDKSTLTLPTDPASKDVASSFRYDVAINCKNNWYGRGRTDTVTLHVTDISATPSTAQDIVLVTNTCNPSEVVSTGVGVTLLASPVYAFVPNAAGMQVIGETSTNNISPLYALLYNVSIVESSKRPFGLFVSPGVGLTSTSSSATADFLAGLSIGFARRLIFVTGSADFGRRTTLMPGFAQGTPMGNLTSVPTRTDWQTGAMVSISFSVSQ